MIKVDIISGFLGAGKTTFIKELIAKAYQGEKIVLIENEFGEIGIDSCFMQNAGIEVTEMNSGCICCTLVGDFAKALKKAAEQFQPDRILIEPSGVGKLSEVMEAVMSVQEEAGLAIDSRITVVDGKKAKMYLRNFNEFFGDQIAHAATLVISRTQMLTDKKLKECMALLRQYNEEAVIVTTPWDKLDRKTLLSAVRQGGSPQELLHMHRHGHAHRHGEACGCHGHHHDHHAHDHHHADEIFDSWGIQTVHRFDRAELEDTLKLFSTTDSFGNILRAKGIVEGDEGQWLEFDMVPDEVEIRKCAPDYTGRICVIGTELNREQLVQVFGR